MLSLVVLQFCTHSAHICVFPHPPTPHHLNWPGAGAAYLQCFAEIRVKVQSIYFHGLLRKSAELCRNTVYVLVVLKPNVLLPEPWGSREEWSQGVFKMGWIMIWIWSLLLKIELEIRQWSVSMVNIKYCLVSSDPLLIIPDWRKEGGQKVEMLWCLHYFSEHLRVPGWWWDWYCQHSSQKRYWIIQTTNKIKQNYTSFDRTLSSLIFCILSIIIIQENFWN